MKSTTTAAIFTLLCFFSIKASAQESRFFMPLEIKQAYEKGTRSYDGKPGPNYWQNTVDYTIDVTIMPVEKMISGKVRAIYHNSSPDELNSIVVRLYADAFKRGNPRMSILDKRDLHDGVEIDNVTINGEAVSSRRNGTNMIITLAEPLAPGTDLTFDAEWKQQIPQFTRHLRQRAYDSASYFVAYWYPQIAVYDDLFGWDNLEFNFLSEFYNNLANFDVTINAPKEFIIWATGTLENAGDIFPSAVYKKYQKARSSGEMVSIITDNEIEKGFGLKNGTWHFTASEVSDFAFAMSDHHRWDAVMQSLGNREVLISSVYRSDTAKAFSEHIAMQQKAMQYLSKDIPGIPYPYEAFTTFINGRGGGMEFPMMANNGGPGRGVTIHEMFHTYFPMYVRINEKRWAWMDEGWANFNTSIVSYHYFQGNHEISDLFASNNPSNTRIMGTVRDLPLITSTEFISNTSYGYASYTLPAMIYTEIYHELGEELFLKCYREYIKRWAKRSPSPYDFFYTFENVSGRDLSWVWKPWFFEFGYADVAIESMEGDRLTVVNKGNRPVPVITEINYKDERSVIIADKAGIWSNGEKRHYITIPEADNVKSILVNVAVADVDLSENIYPSVKSMYEDVELSAELLGTYRLDRYRFNFDLVLEDGVLHLKTNWGKWVLYPKNELNFVSLDKSMQLSFSLDDFKAFESLKVNWFASQLKATKL